MNNNDNKCQKESENILVKKNEIDTINLIKKAKIDAMNSDEAVSRLLLLYFHFGILFIFFF